MEFKPVFPTPSKSTPRSLLANAGKKGTMPRAVMRDQLTLSTWLLLGASAHGVLSLLLPQSAIYISGLVLLILGFRFSKTLLQTYGLIHNPEMDGVIFGKVSAQIPDVHGHMPTEPSQEGVVVMMLGFKSNHPLGSFAPGVKETGKGFTDMHKALNSSEGREKYGFLGISTYLGTGSATSNEFMTLSYWRNIEGIHEFAHSPVHKEVWDWWNRTEKKHPHLSILHEIYRAEGRQGAHESIYVNSKPTLLGGTAYSTKVTTAEKEDSELAWRSPLVEAKRGVLASSSGRLGIKHKK